MTSRGQGSVRQRRPGVWEVRIALGAHPVTGRSVQRSVTVYGDREDVEARRRELAATAMIARQSYRPCPALTVGELLERWMAVDHGWRPSTVVGYWSNVRFLIADPLSVRRVSSLTPAVVIAAMSAWRSAGTSDAVMSGRIRVLRSALGWARLERLIDHHPLDGMRGPCQNGVRLHAPFDQVRSLIAHAETEAAREHNDPRARHRAEQLALLVRLAADSGARRGELAALRMTDLDGRVLTIERAASHEQIGPTKSRRVRRITLGHTAATAWQDSVRRWTERAGTPVGPWLFSPIGDHAIRLQTSTLGHWFADLAKAAGTADVTLHRLRHSVATHLVSQGKILQAQNRLGHREASTTLRIYSHVLPLQDEGEADDLDELYR